MGIYLLTLLSLHVRGGGRGRFAFRFSLPTYWTDALNPKTAYDNPGHELSKYIGKFYLNANDDSRGQIES